jgi:neutral ceramidase
MHLDTVGGNEYSADYPVYLSETLRKQFGSNFVSLFGTGTCGNINHNDVSRPGPQKGHDGATREIGQTLARTVSAAIPALAKVGQPSLGVRSETIFVPLQNYTEEELAWAESGASPSRYPGREFLQQRRRNKVLSLKSMRENEAIPPSTSGADWNLPLEVHAFRLSDDTAMVTLPGEVFVELGLAIKKGSPFKNTLVIELANAGIAYVPNREAFAQGDYEVINSRVQPGGGEMLVESALRLLHELKLPIGKVSKSTR